MWPGSATRWRVAFAALTTVTQAVSIFGSARTPPDHPHYQLARAVAARLGARGFDIITGGGPGIMAAANQGARDAMVRSIGLVIELPYEQATNPFVDLSLRFRYFFVRKVMFIPLRASVRGVSGRIRDAR
ncbi:LOG family protein [Mycobacterium persicum]|uniref:LOG family protein n=1 Tax=Mycobacterium persicum TaxID=1487726 RepID=UPI0021800E62|nr:LOG family protein [Mycobacterium persicum]